MFAGAQMGGDGAAADGNLSGQGLPLSEADGMPSLSGMSPSDAAAFLQGNKKVSPPDLYSCWKHSAFQKMSMS